MNASPALISISRLRVRKARYLIPFFRYVAAISRQVRRAPGFLGGKLLYESGNTFWTMTLWRDETSMRSFQTAGAHFSAMPKLLEWCDEASVAHWSQTHARLLDWQSVHQGMMTNGRQSKVYFPSQAQQESRIAEPRWSPFEISLKPNRVLDGEPMEYPLRKEPSS